MKTLDRVPTVMENHGKPWKMRKYNPGLEKSWKMGICQKVMEKSWNIEFSQISLTFPLRKMFVHFRLTMTLTAHL